MEISQINEYLYISGLVTTKNFDQIEELGIKSIINLVPKKNYPVNNRFNYLYLPFTDASFIPKRKFKKIFKFIESHKDKGKILIHCELGISRSPAIAIGQLLLDNPAWDWKEALEIVRKSREVYVSTLIKFSLKRYIKNVRNKV